MTKSTTTSFLATKQFPENFLLGTATGAYQVEGAWDEDKTPHFWDDYFHNQERKQYRYFLNMPSDVIEIYQQKGVQPRVVDNYKGMAVYEVPRSAFDDGDVNYNYNGDVAADTYHKTDVDIELLKELGVSVYSFSMSMCRIFPKLHDHSLGVNGIQYYNNLIDKLIENGITPVVLLYHFDGSISVNNLGGITNVTIRPFYHQYVRFCFKTFGDRVKHWISGPDMQLMAEGYGSEHFAPGFQESIFSGHLDYMALHNMIVQLCIVCKIYKAEFQEKQKGEIGITINGSWYYPQDPSNPGHEKAAKSACLSTFGMIVHALATGKYPDEVLEAVDTVSKIENLSIGRLQQFTDEEQEIIKGAFDFIVFNYYSSIKVRPMTETEFREEPNLKRRDRGFFMDFVNITPEEIHEGLLNCLKYMDKVMDKPKIFIGENGFPEQEGVDESVEKISYHTGILNKVLEALDEDINVFGYCVWSFLDTLEFTFGYEKKFGIYAVDFNSPSRDRSKKNSFRFFQQLFQTKKLSIQ